MRFSVSVAAALLSLALPSAFPCDAILNGGGGFLASNEVDPQHARPLFNMMKPGVLVTVGTERGLLYAGMSENVKGLALVDRDPAVIQFNRINLELLKAARNREDYVALRLNATAKQWAQRVPALKNPAYWSWWKAEVRNSSHRISANQRFYIHEEGIEYFSEVNYLYHEDQFARVKLLADEDRILIFLADIADSKAVEMIAAELRAKKLSVTAADVSNAWEDQYAKGEGMERFGHAIAPALDSEALLILTVMQSSKRGYWKYYGYRFKNISEWDSCPGCFWRWFLYDRRAASERDAEVAFFRTAQPSPALLDVLGSLAQNAPAPKPGSVSKLLASKNPDETRLALDATERHPVVDARVLAELGKLVGSPSEDIRRDAIYAASKLATGAASDPIREPVLRFLYALLKREKPGLSLFDPMIAVYHHDANRTRLRRELRAFRKRLAKSPDSTNHMLSVLDTYIEDPREPWKE